MNTGSRRDDDGGVEITLSAEVGSKDSNLLCDDNVPGLNATRSNIPSDNYCQSEDSELISYADENQAGGRISFSDDHPVITSTTKAVRCASPIAEFAIPGAAVNDPNRDNGDDAVKEKEKKPRLYISIHKKKKGRAGRARLYTYRDTKGMAYYIPIYSRLREKYRSFATRNEKCEFVAKNAWQSP